MTLTLSSVDQSNQSISRVAIYCRVSSAAQEENSSLGTQESGCRDYAREHGWAVIDVFQDVHTGAELFERNELTRLRERIRSGTVDIVLAYALDRISRNQAHLGFLVSELDHHGVQLAFVTEDLANTPEGRLLQSVRGFVAEIERLKIAERTKRGVRARVDSGRPIPGQKAPYGYTWRDTDRSGFVFNDDEVPIVRRLFNSILEGGTLRGVANQLTLECIPTPTQRGKRWEVSTMSQILKHPVYTGNAAAYRTRYQRVQGRVRITSVPESEWVSLPSDVAPPIISRETFDAVAARLTYNKAVAPRNNADPTATLLRCGIGRCGYCGHPLQITRRKNRSHMYRCHPVGRERYNCPSFGVKAHILDAVVWGKVEMILLDPTLIAQEVSKQGQDDSFAYNLGAIERRLTDIEGRQSRIARAIATLDDPDSSGPLLLELKQLAADARTLNQERDRIQLNIMEREQKQIALTDLDAWCARVAENLHTLSYPEKRSVLETLGVSVRVFSATHEPRWIVDIQPMPNLI